MNWINHDNSHRGLIYQDIVAKFLEEKTGLQATTAAHDGVDVRCGEYEVEVKGTKSLYQKTKLKKTKRRVHNVRGWKTQPKYCPDTITHFAFVLDEQHVSSKPIIYMVPIEYIRERFEKYPTSEWVHFPLWWVWDHYNYKLSRIP